jgi:hypothetical protein
MRARSPSHSETVVRLLLGEFGRRGRKLRLFGPRKDGLRAYNPPVLGRIRVR